MTAEDKQPVSPEDAIPELVEEDDFDLEELVADETPTAVISEDPSTPTDDSKALVDKLQQELAVVKQQMQERDEQYMRLYADFENFRRRTQREKDEISQQQKRKFILEILPTVDNFERAQQQIKLETEREKSLHESYQSVYRLLVDTLKKMGVSRMKSVGQAFDPNLHEAIARQPSNDVPEDTVLTEYQPGYKLEDWVIRHAMVSVSVPGEAAAPAAAPTGAEGGSVPSDSISSSNGEPSGGEPIPDAAEGSDLASNSEEG